MRLIAILGAGLIAFSGTFVISNNTFAAETNEEPITNSTKPTLAELNTAIKRIESIENFSEYFFLSDDELVAATKWHNEYKFLFNLAEVGDNLIKNYDSSSAEKLNEFITLAETSETAYGYLLGTVRRNYLAQNPPTPEPEQPQPSTSTAQTPDSSISSPTPIPAAPAPTNISQAPVIPTQPATPATPTTESPVEISDQTLSSLNSNEANANNQEVSIPATGQTETNNKPLFITIGAVALACLFVGSMLILNRKKPYRPGRKF